MKKKKDKKRKAVILGAGVTGIAAAWRLAQHGFDVKVVEKEDHIGGQAWTFKHNGFLLDLGPHKIFSNLDYVMETLHELLQEDLIEIEKKSRILVNGKYINFPINPKEMIAVLRPWQAVRVSYSFLTTLLFSRYKNFEINNYEDWMIKHFGRAMYEMFVRPATEKIWGESHSLGVELAETRMKQLKPSMELFKEAILKIKPDRLVNAKTFFYPRYGIGMIPDKMLLKLKELGGLIKCNLHPDSIETDNNRITKIEWSDGSHDNISKEDIVISTIPKMDFISILDSGPDEDTSNALESLRERSIILVYIIVNKRTVTDDNWIFFPEKEIVFNRLFEQKNCSPYMCPEDKTILCLEVTCHFDDPIWRASVSELYDKVVKNLQTVGLVKPEEIAGHFQMKLPHAYPILDIYYKGNLETVLDYFDKFENLYSIGRQGGSIYGGVPDCMDMGFITANFIISRKPYDKWKAERERFTDYIVID